MRSGAPLGQIAHLLEHARRRPQYGGRSADHFVGMRWASNAAASTCAGAKTVTSSGSRVPDGAPVSTDWGASDARGKSLVTNSVRNCTFPCGAGWPGPSSRGRHSVPRGAGGRSTLPRGRARSIWPDLRPADGTATRRRARFRRAGRTTLTAVPASGSALHDEGRRPCSPARLTAHPQTRSPRPWSSSSRAARTAVAELRHAGASPRRQGCPARRPSRGSVTVAPSRARPGPREPHRLLLPARTARRCRQRSLTICSSRSRSTSPASGASAAARASRREPA